MSSKDGYYIPHRATWPWVGTTGLAIMLAGFANVLNESAADDDYWFCDRYYHDGRLVYVAVD